MSVSKYTPLIYKDDVKDSLFLINESLKKIVTNEKGNLALNRVAQVGLTITAFNFLKKNNSGIKSLAVSIGLGLIFEEMFQIIKLVKDLSNLNQGLNKVAKLESDTRLAKTELKEKQNSEILNEDLIKQHIGKVDKIVFGSKQIFANAKSKARWNLALRITAIAAIVIAGIGAFVLTKPVIIAGMGVFLLTKPLIIAGGVTYLATRALIDNSTVSKNEIKIAGKIESKVGYMNELNGCVNNLSDLSIGRFVPKNAQENFEYFKHLYKVQSENESKPLFDNDIDASYDIISGNMIDGYVSNLSYLSINYYVKNRNDAQENLNYYSGLYEFQTVNEDKPLFENNLDLSYDIIDKVIKKYQRELGSLG